MIAHAAIALAGWTALPYAPAPPDNPLKGLVPYENPAPRFPHSMEFNYLPLNALMVGEERYDWTRLEALLESARKRGNQTVFRVWVEYPGQPTGVPKFLLDGGLKMHRYTNTNTQPLPPAPIETPDYGDPRLRAALERFIAALGKRYDGDPRIGAITAGLLGTWGEWHTYPRNDLHPPKGIQTAVMDAYTRSFRRTPVLLRYPAGDDALYASNARRSNFGYHDDSFAWATLDTGRPEDSWFFMTRLKAAGATDRWKTAPIGGEIRPEAWGQVFDARPADPQIQDFRKCVEATHASWLMDTGMFRKESSPDRRTRAIREVQRMGYEYTVRRVRLSPQRVEVEIENRGVAPFYQDWPVLIRVNGKIVRTPWALKGLLPGERRIWDLRTPVRGAVEIGIPNPMPGGKPLRFANPGDSPWLRLGEVR